MIGVDFGGTQIKAGTVRDGVVTRSVVRATGAGAAPDVVLDAIAQAVLELDPAPKSVGLAIPGEVNAAGKVWRLPNVPGFEGVNIADELRRRIGEARVAVENDATAAALGERLYGHGRKAPSFLLVTLGTGIGSGLVIGGRLVRGANGFAGEFGHVTIDPGADAWPCNCGLTGCVEAYCGTSAMFRRYADLGGSGADTILEISERARAGDAAAAQTFHATGRSLGLGLAGVQNLLDLDAIVFSGGISASFDLIEPGVRESLQQRAFAPPLGAVPLLVSELGEFAGLIGAAHLLEA